MRRPRLPALLGGIATVTIVIGLAPPAAMACSCAAPDAFIPDLPTSTTQVAFVGTPHLPTPAGVPVSVAGWYGGPAPGPEVMLAVQGGDGASCGRDAPMAGFAHLFVVFRMDDGRYGLSLCDVAMPIDAPETVALAERIASVMGAPIPVADGPPSHTRDLAATIGALAPTVLSILVGLLIVVGLFAWVSRRETH